MATPIQHLRSAITSRAIDARTQIENLKAVPARLKLAMHLLKPVLKGWPELGPNDSFEIHGDSPASTYLTIRLVELESMKDSRLMEVLESFIGVYWKADKTEDSEFYSGPARWFNFTGRFPTGDNDTWGYPMFHRPIYVSVLAVVKTDSPLCTKVKVRDEIVTTTKPIYEIVCV